MAKAKSNIILQMDKSLLTEEQRKSLNDAIHDLVAKQLKAAAKANNVKGQSTTVPAAKKAMKAAPDLTKTATIKCTFTKVDAGKTKLTASCNDIEKELSQSGTLTFSGLTKNDLVAIDGTSLGNVTITIDIDAKPTQMNFGPGNFNDNFIIR